MVVTLAMMARDALAVEHAPHELTFRVERAGNALLLPVTIAGRHFRFLFDTGSTCSAVDVSLKHLLGEPTRTERLFTPTDRGQIDGQLFKAPRLSLGDRALDGVVEMLQFDFRKKRFVISDSQVPDGILGMDALKDLIASIDFDRGELSLLASVPEYAGRKFPLIYRNGMPWVAARPGGDFVQYRETPLFLLDTGNVASGSGTIGGGLFALLDHAERFYDVHSTMRTTLIGTAHTRGARLRALQLGDFEQRGLIFAEGSLNSLSLDYLSRYRVVFDFPGNCLFLSAGARYAEPDRRDLSDVSFRRAEHGLLVNQVKEPSAASAAGLRAADLIVDVDGVRAQDISAVDLRRTLGAPGVRSLIVHRAGELLRIRLVLSGAIPEPPPLGRFVLDPDGRFRRVGSEAEQDGAD